MVAEVRAAVRLLDRRTVASLARTYLPNYRLVRYRGEEQAIPLEDFTQRDRVSITCIYALLKELDVLNALPEPAHELAAFALRPDVSTLGDRLRALGDEGRYGERVLAALHDLRGGALNALLLHLANLCPGADGERALAIMTRDVLKLARTLIRDLDAPLRARDLERRLHSVVDLQRALEHFQDSTACGRVRLALDVEENAFVAASCVELGTVERVAFNLLQNAAVHSSGLVIEGSLMVIGEHVRVAIANAVAPEQRARLRRLLARDPAVLYSEFSTTGSGKGLQIAADLVARAYGVETIHELVEEGYVGTVLTETAFVAWFHWPIAQ